MHDAIFRNQATLADGDLTQRAREVGLDIALFSDCVSGDRERLLIERQRSAARNLSVRPQIRYGHIQAHSAQGVGPCER